MDMSILRFQDLSYDLDSDDMCQILRFSDSAYESNDRCVDFVGRFGRSKFMIMTISRYHFKRLVEEKLNHEMHLI